MKKYSLFELQAYLQRVIALNFQDALWVNAEIFQIKESRGHVYLELVDKNEDSHEIRAQCQAVIWSKNLTKLRRTLGSTVFDLLKEGIEVSLQVEVSYHPVYGLKLSVLHLDAGYTLGKMELLRQETILKLKKQGLLEFNSLKKPSRILQRIAIISSAGASGYLDFTEHLKSNEFNYQFSCTLFNCAMQGRLLEPDILNAFQNIEKNPSRFDVIVIIRGGGSKLDLAGFDLYPVARAIALSSLPVLTGIGHETDATVSDLVAFRSFKTPTAVANYLLDHNASFESEILTLWQQIMYRSAKVLNLNQERLRMLQQQVFQASRRSIRNETRLVETARENVLDELKKSISFEQLRMQHLIEKIDLVNPVNILQKGYSITFRDGEWIKDKQSLKVDEVLTTRYRDGAITSRIEKI